MQVTKQELLHIFIAWLVISLAFAWRGFSAFSLFLSYVPIILVATGTGFIIHELAHKFTAIYYGCKARFFMWPSGLFFAVILSLATGGSFVFAAPGAVYIWGKHTSRRENGIISLAGPLSNLLIAIVFLGLVIGLVGVVTNKFVLSLLYTVMNVNLFLGLFNLLPVPPLDGYKVIRWSIPVWAIMLFIFVGLFVLLSFL